MRIFFILLVLGVLPARAAVNTTTEDDLVKNSHLSCKLSRDIRRRDAAQSKSAFQFYIDNKSALLAIDDDYLVDGLTAEKVKKFCERIAGDFQRQDALLIYDKASSACRASHLALEKGQLKQAKQQYALYKSSLELASDTSSAAIDLERGSLQWRKCQDLEGDLGEFTSGRVKKVQGRLDRSYSRCLPIWSELSTQKQSSLSVPQLSAQLSIMRSELAALRPAVKKLKTSSVDAGLHEFATCIVQVGDALPQQYVQNRLSALSGYLTSCQSGVLTPEERLLAQALLGQAAPDDIVLSAGQRQNITYQSLSLSACLDGKAVESGPLQLDLDLNIDQEEGDVIEKMLSEEVVDNYVPAPRKPAAKSQAAQADEHWEKLRKEPISIGR